MRPEGCTRRRKVRGVQGLVATPAEGLFQEIPYRWILEKQHSHPNEPSGSTLYGSLDSEEL